MSHRLILFFLFFLPGFIIFAGEQPGAWTLKSPDGNIHVRINFRADDGLTYEVTYKEIDVLERSSVGVVFDDLDFSRDYAVESASETDIVRDAYNLPHGKKLKCLYVANEKSFHLTKSGDKLDVIFRVSNDGVAFRYFFPTMLKNGVVLKETSSFNFPDNAKGFLQPMSRAKSGWSHVNPCYEEFYETGIAVSKPSAFKQGWVYPALFQVNDAWVLVTEAGLDENYCGTHLADGDERGVFQIAFPQQEEVYPGGGLLPRVVGNAFSPWRILVIGGLNTIIESTLGTDLAAAPVDTNAAKYPKPGHSSWSWALLKDDSIVYSVQRKFVDYSASMGWEYCLVDVNWDKKIGYERIRELSQYAQSKGVGLILWYNSSGSWNETPYTPKGIMLTHESRTKEFARLKELGIKGLKIDFFGGDGQSFVKYYLDILKDAAAYNLLINFHGSTIPRGWHRTYPNLVSAEAVKGFEYVTFEQPNADLQPSHCTVLPFTRNAFDPMDFTPLSLYKVPGINRRTSGAFELALSVIFLSGIQHFVETPAGMSHMPTVVKDFLTDLPVTWEETRFISGYPGRDLILARRSGNTWYVAGINGQATSLRVDIDLGFAGNHFSGYLIKDGVDEFSFDKTDVKNANMNINVNPNAGFVIVLSMKD